MNKLFATVSVCAIFAAFPQANAQEASATYGINTQYVGANDGIVYDDDVQHTLSLDYSSSQGWYVGAWVGEDFDGEADFGNEVDLYGGMAWSASDFDFDAGLAYYFLTGPDAWNGSFRVSKTYGQFTPYFGVNTYVPVDGDGFEPGEIYQAGLGVALYESDSWMTGADVGVIYDTGPFGNPEGTSAILSLSTSFEVTENVSLTLSATQFFALSADKENTSFVGATVTKGF